MHGELIVTEYVESRRRFHILQNFDLLVNQDLAGISGQAYVKLVTAQ